MPFTPPPSPRVFSGLRRSARHNPLDSNGRDFLAAQLNFTRTTFEAWLTSPSVLPHLQLWHTLCISSAIHYNTAISWINTGGSGYFYSPTDLEEDLLLLCLGQGSGPSSEGIYADPQLDRRVTTWSTQDLWARTAWRIVEANAMDEGVFAPDRLAGRSAAAAYGQVIDLLCVAFHSIAFRGRGSWYAGLIGASSGAAQQKILRVLEPITPESMPALREVEVEEEDSEASTSIFLDDAGMGEEDTPTLSMDIRADPDFELDDGVPGCTSRMMLTTQQNLPTESGMVMVEVQKLPVEGNAYTRQWVAALGTDYRGTIGGDSHGFR